MARTGPLLTEAQWKKIAPLLPKSQKHRRGGRPWIGNRRVLEGILWILRSGARWQDLPGNIRILRRAGDDCGIGRSKGFGREFRVF